MNDGFGSPIFVRDGKYIVHEITCIADAIDYLEDWPENRRTLIHEVALKACYESASGSKPKIAGRNAFVGFAKKSGILEDPEMVMPWMSGAKSGGGRMPV